MNDDKYIALIHKSLSESLADTEQSELSTWLAESEDHVKIFAEIKDVWQMTDDYPDHVTIDLDDAYAKVQKKISKASPIVQQETNAYRMQRSSDSRQTWLGIAASLLVLVAAGYLLWPNSLNQADDIVDQINVIASTDNQQYTLPDGSIIRLEKGSQITYIEKFESRKINFAGSGYFAVAKDQTRPFVIQGPNSTVTVLGTSFIYQDEKSGDNGFVQMTEGTVRLTVGQGSTTLHNSEGVRFTKDQLLSNKGVIHPSEYNWHTYVFNYQNTSLTQVAQEIGNRMEARLDIPDHLKNCTFTGSMAATSLKDVATIISAVYGADMVDTKDGIQLKGGSCQ